MASNDTILRPAQRRFLKCFEACASITVAARWSKIQRQTHYDWLRDVPGYRGEFEQAQERAMRTLEDEAVRRAHQGVRRAVRYKGKVVGYDTEYSDTLLITMLKGGLPEKYRERTDQRHSGPDGKALLDLNSVRAFMQESSKDG